LATELAASRRDLAQLILAGKMVRECQMAEHRAFLAVMVLLASENIIERRLTLW
jgi:hypothetical protein